MHPHRPEHKLHPSPRLRPRLSAVPVAFFYPVLLALLLALVQVTVAPSNAAAQISSPWLKDDPTTPWHISADEIHHDQKTDQYVAIGNVSITKPGRNLTADYVRFDHNAMKALAVGHVVMTTGEDVLIGNTMDMDLKTETGTLYEGTIFLKANHFYIKGDKIQKVGKESYEIDKASLSTCDGDRPAWKITGRNLKVTIEGYGTVTHAALWAKSMPVAYTPFLIFPAKTKRQSGFLPPQIGQSERKDFEYAQPYFWAINESSDATFYYHHMERRGEKFGLEYRYVLDEQSKGTLMYDFLNDRKIDDGKLESSKDWGYEDDSVLRPNQDRYWFRMKHDQALPSGFTAKLDVDVVSDQDYLHEFKTGYTGFDESKKYFTKDFGRDLDDYNDPVRLNKLNLNKTWSAFNLNAETRWYDNVIARRQQDTDTTLQQLPVIEFNGSKQRLLASPFYFDLDSEYTYFYREDGTRGHREDAYSRLYLPYRHQNYFTLEPSVGVRETAWQIEEYEDGSSGKDRMFHREIYDTRLDLSTEVYNIFPGPFKNIEKIKHAVRPQVVYDYTPNQVQDKYPSFDALDRIAEKNLITYSVTNTFTSKSLPSPLESAGKEAPGEDEPPEPLRKDKTPQTPTYSQFSRLKLEQSYDINEESAKNKPVKRPFSPVLAEFELIPARYFSLRADATWSQYESDFLTHNVAAEISDVRKDKLFVEHRYTQGSSESIYIDLLLIVTGSLSAYADYEHNLYTRERISSRVGAVYKAQCWSIDFRYVDEVTDRKFEFMVNLYGLGEIGSDVMSRKVERPFERID